MAADSLEIQNRALVLLGETPLPFLGVDEISSSITFLYEPLIAALLGKTSWKFARERASLVATTAPTTQWTYAHTLPTLNTTRIGAPLAFFASAAINSPPIKEYELRGATVESNHAALWCAYTKRVAESLWPESFARFASVALAAEIAEPVTGQKSTNEKYHEMAFGLPVERGRGGLFLEALQEDSWGSPDISIMDSSDPILEARWG